MAQSDLVLSNQTFPAMRSEMNDALQALGSLSSGASAPSTTYAYQLWADTTTGLLKIRNAANSAWINIGTLSATGLGLLSKSGGSLTGAIDWAKGADIASATTADIGAAGGNFIFITGTTAIASFGTVQAGTTRIVRFTGALSLAYNATSMILPTAASITTAAGDTAVFVSLGSGNWVCVSYQRASGVALAGAVAPNQQAFTSSGTWTKPSTGTYARVQVWGGGGGGAGLAGVPGSGGGGGSYKEATFLLADLGSSVSVTIGSGGAGGGTAGAGGTTSFGSHIYGYGGSGGSAGGERGGSGGGYLATATVAGNDIVSAPETGLAHEGKGAKVSSVNSAIGGYYTGGGGGGGGFAAAPSVYGGGGGAGSSGSGGASVFGGAGASASGGAGTQPGGGGGGSAGGGGGSAGAGGAGKCVVWTW
jgi:hypothetical protein